MTGFRIRVVFLAAGLFVSSGTPATGQALTVARDASGYAATVGSSGFMDSSNPFFQSLGSNGRSCGSCHDVRDGWSITPEHLRERFENSGGLDPVFRPNDGSSSPLADVSTIERRRAAYSMLLSKGLIRIGLPVPPNGEFELITADDPYGFASAGELSLFRRPLPSTNLRFLSAVMWDGRETTSTIKTSQDLLNNLALQAMHATMGHAQATSAVSMDLVDRIVAFETGLYTTQYFDDQVGPLMARGATGGPASLSTQPFFIGINDPLGGNPTGEAFDRQAMTLFEDWTDLEPGGSDPVDAGNPGDRIAARQAVARGERIFNARTFILTGVGGLNDALNLPQIPATCTTCHDTPNTGNHSVPLAINLGLTDESRRTTDLPLYTLRNKTTGAMIKTTDPGRALITGKWTDIGKFKGPVLRGLAARAPYFHNGSAATLLDAVQFYDERFEIGLTADEKADLVAFLRSL